MPIYAYRCSSCGHAQDVLRKISDPPLSTCPACQAETFTKQLTAAGFQLKGSGWYVTDFRGGSNSGGSNNGGNNSGGGSGAGNAGSGGDAGGSTPSTPSTSSGSSDSGSSSATSATACGGSCACH